MSTTPEKLWSTFLAGWQPTPAEFYATLSDSPIPAQYHKAALRELAMNEKIVFGYHQETDTWRIAAHNQGDIAREMLAYGLKHFSETVLETEKALSNIGYR